MSEYNAEAPGRVVVTDIKMPFWSMVVFITKWAIASIPALILLAVFVVAVAAISATFVSGIMGNVERGRQSTERPAK